MPKRRQSKERRATPLTERTGDGRLVGIGGARRRTEIDAVVDEAQRGRQRDNQSTDSNN